MRVNELREGRPVWLQHPAPGEKQVYSDRESQLIRTLKVKVGCQNFIPDKIIVGNHQRVTWPHVCFYKGQGFPVRLLCEGQPCCAGEEESQTFQWPILTSTQKMRMARTKRGSKEDGEKEDNIIIATNNKNIF